MKENKTVALLNCMYQTCSMGITGILDVIDKSESQKFKEILNQQMEEYRSLKHQCEELFSSYGEKETELGKMAQVNSKVMSNVKMLTNKCDSTISEMMIEGTNKGIIKVTKAFHAYDKKDKELQNLVEKLLETMKYNIEQLTIYL